MSTQTHQVATLGEGRHRLSEHSPEVSVVMPCLNEAASVADCVRQALDALERYEIDGEVIVCDNGSTDGSGALAAEAGARVVREERRGYGSAYLRAFQAAKGRYLIMADADGTYDFQLIPQFLEPLKKGHDLVMGSRIQGPDAKRNIPLLHRYIGVPLLTGMLNVVAGGSVSDAHCGMRAFTREALERMRLSTTGMEFASEMILKAIRGRMKIAEIPIPYYTRVGESKLRSFRDGWRHIRFLLLESPTFLFVLPGLLMMLLGVLALGALTPGRLLVGGVTFDFHYMIVAALLAILGWQVLTLGLFAKVFAVIEALSPPDRVIAGFLRRFTLERGLMISAAVAVSGLGLLGWVVAAWAMNGFGFSESTMMLRPAIFGMTLLVVGTGTAFSSFFLSALTLERRTAVGPAAGPR